MTSQRAPGAVAARHAVRCEMRAMTDRLIADFAGRLPADAVRAQVFRCRERMLATGVRDGLVAATEAASRVRLAGQVPIHPAL